MTNEEFFESILPMTPLATIAIFFIIGLVLDSLVKKDFFGFFKDTKWRENTFILKAFHRVFTFWSLLLGLYLIFPYLSLSQNIIEISNKVLIILLILSATRVCSKLAVGFVNVYAHKVKDILPRSSIFSNLANLGVLLIGLLIILQALGISITPILTALGIGGLAVALALQDSLSNLFSGLTIILSKQVRPGDYIKFESGEEGYVTDITWRNTTVRELSNNRIIVPNSKLASVIVKNYSLPDKDLSVLIQVGVSYDSDLDKVERVTVEVARDIQRKVEGSISDFEPFIRYHTFADSSINFSVIMRAKEFSNQYLIKHEFVKRLHKRYAEEEITIPYPIRVVQLQDKIESRI